MSKEIRKISWVMEDEPVIKLLNPDETYDIADNVFKYLKEKNLLSTLEDKQVEVEIEKNQGQNGTVTFLKVVDGKEEPKKEEKRQEKVVEPTVGVAVMEITVGGVSVEKAGVVDKETKKWYTLDSSINAQTFKDQCTKKTIQVTIAKQDKGNDVIKGYVLKEEKEDPRQPGENATNSEKSNKSNYSSDVQRSIEAQASVNSANEVVAQMKEILLDPQKVLTTITKIAEHNFELIQSLKKKE